MTDQPEKRKPKYHVIVWGNRKGENEELRREYHTFDTVADLNGWLMINRPNPHPNDAPAGRCMLRLQDGRDCLIIKGHAKAIKQTVSVRVG